MGAKRGIRATLVLAVMAIFATIAQSPAAAAPTPTAHASVIGGKPASIEEFPSLAYISGSDLGGEYSCTGTVVAPRLVLTAGHCVEDVELIDLTPVENFRVTTGAASHVKPGKGHISTVSRAIVNPRFNPSWVHGDAALLVLSAPVAAAPLPIASDADSALLAAGTPVAVAGWGLTDVEEENGPARLQSGTNLVQSPTFCKRHSEADPHYTPAVQLCAIDLPGHAVGACFGDSGGPAIARRADGTAVQVGITSLGGLECSPKGPTVFTRVDRISAWVSGWIAAVETGAPPPQLLFRPPLPLLPTWRAREVSFAVLERDFPRTFLLSDKGDVDCARSSRTKVRCKVNWRHGRNDYSGAITSFYAIQDYVAAVEHRYTISWVSHRCRTHNPHPQTCPVHRRHG